MSRGTTAVRISIAALVLTNGAPNPVGAQAFEALSGVLQVEARR